MLTVNIWIMSNMSNIYNIEDTIVALSTAYAKSALAVIRLSGKDALNITESICQSVKSKKSIKKFEHRKSYYVNILDSDNSLIDELVILTTLAPNTFTTEDTVEFFPHGSTVVVENLISLLVKKGARLAERGEFTYRAYINGRIGISEAEAIHDLIESDNRLTATASIYKMKGRLSNEINNLRNAVKEVLILIEGELDFPEDETEEFSYEKLVFKFKEIKNKINLLLKHSNTVQKLMNGISVAIIGKVNSGKSSIFNMLLDKDRAIVSNIAGTTRDFLSETIYINSIPFYITDTAGFHKEAVDEIEKEGIERAKKCANDAGVIIAVFDGSKQLDENDNYLINYLNTLNQNNKNIIYVLNKSDEKIKAEIKSNIFNNIEFIKLSAKTFEGKDLLTDLLTKSFAQKDKEIFNNESYVNERERGMLEKSLSALEICIEKSKEKYPLDYIAEEARLLNSILSNVSGKIEAEDIINEIFSRFCIGK